MIFILYIYISLFKFLYISKRVSCIVFSFQFPYVKQNKISSLKEREGKLLMLMFNTIVVTYQCILKYSVIINKNLQNVTIFVEIKVFF